MRPAPSRAPLRRALLYALFFASGVAGLGYQIAWTRMFAVGLGHEMPSVLAVVAAFFGGFALGAWCLDGPVGRSRRPAAWYAALEGVIGAWGLASVVLVPLANDTALRWIGAEPAPSWQWGVSFLLPLLTLLPATAAMGATLPAMERAVARLAPGSRCVGGLYAVNTLGAMAGIAVSMLLLPVAGARLTVVVLAVVNLACAAAMLLLAEGAEQAVVAEPPSPPPPAVAPWRLGGAAFISGLLGIGYEVLGVRVLSQVTQNTVFSFAAALLAYLAGTAAGAALYQRLLVRRAREHFDGILAALAILLGAAVLVGMLVMWRARELEQALRAWLGDGLGNAVTAELLLALLVFAPATLVMGATFSHLVQAAGVGRGGVGRAVALNTLGGAAAPALFGVVLLPTLGARWALTAVALGYGTLIPRSRWSPRLIPLLALPLLLVLLPIDLRIVGVPAGGRLVAFRDGVMAAVAVVEDSRGTRVLKVNNRFVMGGTEGGFCERRLTLIPLLLHPRPRSALFLGIGTGVSFGAAATYPGLRTDGVELVPEVVDLLGEFAPANGAPYRPPALCPRVADARRFVRASRRGYDVVVGDLFHPACDGAGSLYTVEHFRAVRGRLNADGLFCQWLPLYQLGDDMLRVIVRTFVEAFPHARAYLCHFNVDTPMLALVGTLRPTAHDPDALAAVMRDERLRGPLERLALTDPYRLFGCLLADSAELARYGAAAALNTDDRPVVVFGAPRFTYAGEAAASGRLLPFIADVSRGLDDLLLPGRPREGPEEFRRRLGDFIAARNVYLHGMIAAAEGRRDEALDACIESARISGDFTTGYVTVLEAVRAMALGDAAACRPLLRRLAEARPEIGAAQLALTEMGDE